MKYTPDYSSRFRILKGGKISLVVSALLVSSSIVVTNANAVGNNITNASLSATIVGDGDSATTTEDITITNGGYIAVAGNNYLTDININHNVSITDSSSDTSILLNALGSGSSFDVASGKTVASVHADGTGYAIELMSGLTNATLTNAGTISTTVVNDAVTNSTINAFSMFIDGDVDGSTITNSGTINTTLTHNIGNGWGGLAAGINLYSTTGTVANSSIINSGTITTTVNNLPASYNDGSDAVGIKVQAYAFEANVNAANLTITNSGTIGVTVNNADGRWSTARGIEIYAEGYANYDAYSAGNSANAIIDGLALTNTGSITVTGTGSSVEAAGIHIETDAYYGYERISNSTITNSGTISVNSEDEGRGINIDNRMYTTSITNQSTKTITVNASNAYGIYVNRAMYDSSITNNGTISANGTDWATAIYVDDWLVDSTISNSGTINAILSDSEWGYATGIQTSTIEGNSQITNSGTINAKAEGQENSNAFGIKVSNITDTSQILNSGTITAIAGEDSVGIKVRNDINIDAKIINSNTIIATSQGLYDAYARGIEVGSNMLGEIENSGTITVTGENGGYGVNVAGIDVNYLDGGRIDNSGTITVTTALGNEAFGIKTDTFKYGASIDNSGTITVTNNDAEGTAFGISVNSGDNASITNSGTITVSSGAESVGIFVNYTSYEGPIEITNSGTITATLLDGVADKMAQALRSNYETVVNVTNTGTLNGNVRLSPYSSLNNSGTIRLPYNANGDDSGTVGTFINSGTLEIGLLTDGETTTHSQLSVGGTATFDTGSIMKVNVLAASTNVGLLVGATLEDVVSSDVLVVNDLTVTDNSALLNFEHVVDGNTIDLNIVEGTTIFDSTVAGNGTSNAQSAASALQAIQDAGVPEGMSGFYEALGGLTTDEEVAAAVESTTPATVGAVSTANSQIMNGIQGIVEMRQNNVLGGMNSGDMSLTDKNLWAKVYGSRGNQDDKDGVRGFDVKAFGLGIGADAEIAPRSRIGAALFYTDADVDVNSVNQTSDVKVYTALVYGNTPIDATTDFLYQAGYSWQKTESDRNVFGIGNVSADYTAKTASLDLKVMKTYKMDNALTLRPLVETTYRHYTSPSYSESTGGLDIEKFTSTQLIIGGGLIAEYKTGKNDKLIADLSVGYDLHHDDQTVTASYQGAAGVDFTTNGIDNGGWQYDIGLGYETANILGGELNFMYNYQAQGSSFDNHVLSAKYVWKF